MKGAIQQDPVTYRPGNPDWTFTSMSCLQRLMEVRMDTSAFTETPLTGDSGARSTGNSKATSTELIEHDNKFQRWLAS